MTQPDHSDVQGILRFGYSSLVESSYLLLTVRDPVAARAWLAAAPVTKAVKLDKAPDAALQVAFTQEGLRALGLTDAILAGFSAEFLSGMCGEPNRSLRLGDIGANDPENWSWGAPGKVPHLVVMLYAKEGGLKAWTEAIKGTQWDAAFQLLDCLPTSNLDGIEPFGFTDGISQPSLDWECSRETGDELQYTNLSCLGEFLLGYPNEYGKYTDRPLLPDETANAVLPFANDDSGKRDLGRDGSYLVFRTLQQNVRGFWRFVDEQSKGDPEARKKLANAMVGRTREGDPLMPLSDSAIPGVEDGPPPSNRFTYESDPEGTRCPFGAHIRRANPRNADFPAGTGGFLSKLLHNLGFTRKVFRSDVISSTRFHRLLRRGREYGPELTPEDALRNDRPDPGEHGIQFICLNANISRQFEFVQGAWVMSTKFNGMSGESDPLLGNRLPVPGCPSAAMFNLPSESGLARRIANVPQFITVRGGAYFFLPSIRALRYLASLGQS